MIHGAIRRINYIMRDFRTGEIKPIDPNLLDLLYRIVIGLVAIVIFPVAKQPARVYVFMVMALRKTKNMSGVGKPFFCDILAA